MATFRSCGLLPAARNMGQNGWRMDDPITSERFRTVTALAGFSSAFEALFRAGPSPFLVVTPPDYTIIAVNDAYLRATMTERAAVLGRGLFEVFPANPDDPSIEGPPKLRESLERVVAERRLDEMPIVRYDIPQPAAGGAGFEERWWSPRNAPVLGSNGEVVCIIHHVEDVTERVHAEAALHRSEQRLRAAVGERDALLKEVHHRVKNNLQVITSLLEMQARQTADRQALSSLSEARNRITAIAAIHELLYQSGSFTEVDLAAYARRLVRHVVSLYEENSRIYASVDGDGITIDLARAVPFGLLLSELVSNAYKHAFRSRAGGELRVTLHKDGAHVRLRVSDTGVGLPSGFKDRPLVTLGLQLVHMLAKQLGGTVTFDSAGGTSVEVRVPIEGKIG
jgi:two-component sensor histidine kinase